MERSSFADAECPIARAADVLGDAWTLLILREAMKGATHFSDFAAQLSIAPTTLTRKLQALVAHGLFECVVYQLHPKRERYELTDKALEVLPILMAMGTWGNKWLSPKGDLLTIVDADSGKPMQVAVVDKKTGRELRPGNVALIAGRAARRAIREALKKPLVLGLRKRT